MAICSLATADACCSNESEAAASRGRRGGNGGSSRKDMMLSEGRIRIKCPYSTFKSPFRCWTCRLSRYRLAASPAGSCKKGFPEIPIPSHQSPQPTNRPHRPESDHICAPFSLFAWGRFFSFCAADRRGGGREERRARRSTTSRNFTYFSGIGYLSSSCLLQSTGHRCS